MKRRKEERLADMTSGENRRADFARKIAWQLYRCGQSSKTDLVRQLGISLPTVLQNVRALIEHGVVRQDGQMQSRGGRRADVLTLDGESRFALGADVTRNHLSLVAVDLRGVLRWHERLALPFACGEEYPERLREAALAFLARHEIDCGRVLGAGVSLPGILSADGRTLTDSYALGANGYSLEMLERGLPFPMLAVNDANAAALAERRLLPPESNMIYLSLSNTVGGAIFNGSALYTGDHGRAGEFGHMPVVPDGRVCYCGKSGCFDAYCSALRLSAPYGGRLADFFDALARGEDPARDLWREYRRYLVLMCSHLRMAFDCQVMLGGYVGAFLEPYMGEIRREAARMDLFEASGEYVRCCHYKTEAAALGAALLHIERFLDTL